MTSRHTPPPTIIAVELQTHGRYIAIDLGDAETQAARPDWVVCMTHSVVKSGRWISMKMTRVIVLGVEAKVI